MQKKGGSAMKTSNKGSIVPKEGRKSQRSGKEEKERDKRKKEAA